MTMRVLVTGGAGYIGSITTRRLLDAGHDVVVLDSLVRGHRWAIDERADFVKGSVGDPKALSRALPDCDVVMHLAGLIEVEESSRAPAAYFDANVAQPAQMLEAMRGHGVNRLVFSSTAAVYGEPSTVPIPESAPTTPVNVYGATKLMFEQMLEWYERAHGMAAIRLRYFNVAGAQPDAGLGEAHEPETHLIPRILTSIASGERRFEVYGGDYPTPDGTCVRDYIHVSDLAQAHLRALERVVATAESSVMNVGSGFGYSNLEIVRACAEVTGVEIEVSIGPRRTGDPAVLMASTRLAERELDWRPRSGGVRGMVDDAWQWHSNVLPGRRGAHCESPTAT